MKILSDGTRHGINHPPAIVVDFSLEDAEYLVDVFEERINAATARGGKGDGFDIDMAQVMSKIITEHKNNRRRRELDDQIAQLERERDSI